MVEMARVARNASAHFGTHTGTKTVSQTVFIANAIALLAPNIIIAQTNHTEGVYIINSVRNCISPKRSFVYHHCESF